MDTAVRSPALGALPAVSPTEQALPIRRLPGWRGFGSRLHLDALTGLPGRTLLVRRLSAAMLTGPVGRSIAVLLVDIDGMHMLNAGLGYAGGDVVLCELARRLRTELGIGAVAYRIGDDQFAVTVAGRGSAQLNELGDRLWQLIGEPLQVGDLQLTVTAAIGVGVGEPLSGVNGASLLGDAETAMRMAKCLRRNQPVVCDAAMRRTASDVAGVHHDVLDAVADGRVQTHFQPIIALNTLQPVAFEALLRLQRADGSYLAPAQAIPVAEESGAIVPIGEQVLQQACAAVAGWRRRPEFCGLGVSVNVSSHQLTADGRLTEQVENALRGSRLPPGALTLEITETSALDSPQALTTELTSLRELGVQIAVDDFGAGYFSLELMIGLRPDVLKIDRSVLGCDRRRGGSLMTAISELAKSLGASAVAEGVETGEHLRLAAAAGCDAAQGFLFGRPLPPAAADDYLSGLPAAGARPSV